ncbi:histone deacetylase 4 isoform X2 [Sitophilus oryzae]|uniref:histone deacetylase n=1 Tax=Sitophilus oryzae TaxID=7048 RepID=A0A6J2YIL4_SITOR|nr:histone deacetylase 4 isoform X2 [Sitophilus oryzae]
MSWTITKGMADGEQAERELEQQILQIKKQHQLQHQILLQHFHQQQQHLAEQHEQQLRQHLKEFWDRQKQLQEVRQREQLEALRKKEKHEESAVASTEVKQKLQDFLRQRRSGNSKIARPENSCWSEGMDTASDSSTTTNNDFPLRKTASEPNLLKVRLKQRVMERRSSPMSKRLPPSLKKKLLSSCLPPSESPPQEPPKELSPPCEAEEYQRHPLFSSPSMPNISLAAHHVLSPTDLSEAAVRAACTARLGMPLTGQMLPGTLPFYPSLPAIESSEHEETPLDTISELQEPQVRGVIRPLGRTQSSPLPLGHPLLRSPLPPEPEPPQPMPEELEQRDMEIRTNDSRRHKVDVSKLSTLPVNAFVRLNCGGIGVDTDTTWNEHYTAPAARMAVGCTVDLAVRTWTGDIRNGFAIVRPPGHHAEPQQAMGFCFFNSVAIAARVLQKDHRVPKILIFDWDVHHGNGTQDIFYDDPRVLVISMHRHDDGNFFPGTGAPTECGTGAGLGYNVNIAWSGGLNPPLGDAEYMAAFRSIVMPIAREFDPDIVLVSAGFDATEGHLPPLGGYRVSPACFGHMIAQLMHLARGRIVLALEGGYDLPSICDSAEECVRVLLGDNPSPISPLELARAPCANAAIALQKVFATQSAHWPCLREASKTALCSFTDAMRTEKVDKETVTAMASLSMQHQQHIPMVTSPIASSPSAFHPASPQDAGRSPA